MKQIAEADEAVLYKTFGIDAELMIDHAWGREPTTMADIKAYKSKTNCLSSGQVLPRDYSFEEGRIIVREMVDLQCLEMVEKGLVTDSVTLHVGYANRFKKKSAHGTAALTITTSSAKKISEQVLAVYERIVDRNTPIHRVYLTCNDVVDERYQQYDLFVDPAELEREHAMQKAMLEIKERFGKNAILKGMNLQEGATTMERNQQIGGHKSGI